MTHLSVNVNLVAQVRNRRNLARPLPSVVRAAELCLQAGAAGITVHPRPDQRHIRPHDVIDLGWLLRAWPGREYNIEGNPLQNLMQHVREQRPHQATFVPDSEAQPTSDHGWDLRPGSGEAEAIRPLVVEAQALGVRVSLFMDADAAAMRLAKALGADRVELYTEPLARAWGTPDWPVQLRRFADAAQAAQAAGLGVNAGHDLNRDNLTAFLQGVPGVQEVSIGHALMGDALELGYAATVKAYLECIQVVQKQ